MAEDLIGQYGYLGIALVLILGGFGLPVPEELPILAGAILSREGRMEAPLAFGACMVGVLVGDFVVYFLGYYYGERVLKLPIARKVLTRDRERQMKGYFHRHGFKILILGRFAVGFRTAAYLTAGILRLHPLRLFLTDLVAASLSTSLMFGLGWIFSHQIRQGIENFTQVLAVAAAVGIGLFVLRNYLKARRRAGRAVGPPVPGSSERLEMAEGSQPETPMAIVDSTDQRQPEADEPVEPRVVGPAALEPPTPADVDADVTPIPEHEPVVEPESAPKPVGDPSKGSPDAPTEPDPLDDHERSTPSTAPSTLQPSTPPNRT